MRAFWIKILLFILTVIVSFVGLVAFKYSYSDWLSPKTSGIGGLFREKEVDYVFIGSSHTRESYDIELFQKETGKSAYLLCYNGLSPFLMGPLLRFIVEKMPQIKTYVLEVRVHGMVRPPSLEDTRLFFESPVALKHQLLRLFREDVPGFNWQNCYELLVVSNNERILTFPVSNYFISRSSYRGGYVNREIRALLPEEFNELKNPMPDLRGIQVDPKQLASLQAIFQLIHEKKLDVVFVESPLPKPIEEDLGTKLNKQYIAGLIRNEGIQYLDGAENFDTGNHLYFIDNNHLSLAGRKLFTEQVAAFLAKQKYCTE